MICDNNNLLKVIILFILLFILSSCAPPHCSTDFLILAINNANTNPGPDTIGLAPGCVYELDVVDNTIDGNNGLPSITSSVVIDGNGATVRRGTGAQKSAIRLFHISQGGDLTLNDITLLKAGLCGGGVFDDKTDDDPPHARIEVQLAADLIA